MNPGEAVATLPNVAGIIYVTAFVPDVGESLNDLAGQSGLPPWLDPHPEQGYVDVRDPAQIFYSDVDPESAAEYAARVVHQGLSATFTPVGAAAWRDVPSSHILCELDAVISPRWPRTHGCTDPSCSSRAVAPLTLRASTKRTYRDHPAYSVRFLTVRSTVPSRPSPRSQQGSVTLRLGEVLVFEELHECIQRGVGGDVTLAKEMEPHVQRPFECLREMSLAEA